MNLKKITLASLFTLLAIVTIASMVGLAVAMGAASGLQEKIHIANVQFIAATEGVNQTINLTMANLGLKSATIIRCILKDGTGNTISIIEMGPSQ